MSWQSREIIENKFSCVYRTGVSEVNMMITYFPGLSLEYVFVCYCLLCYQEKDKLGEKLRWKNAKPSWANR